MRRPIPHLLTLIIMLSTGIAFGQESQKFWYFGANGIRFDQPDYDPTRVSKPAVAYGNGGGVTVTDGVSGTLLFYTDGTTVYDVNNLAMPNGGGLSGNSTSNSSAVAMPLPGQPGQYYIFTNNASYNTTTGTVQFSIVDMTQFGNSLFPAPPTGDVIQKNQAIPMLTGLAEGMIVIPHSNGTDYWLITQQSGTNNYFVTQVSAGGTFNTTLYMGLGYNLAASAFAYNATTGQLAVAPQSSNVDIHILDFDDSTGALTFNQWVTNSGLLTTTNQAIYDVEWSPDGQFLYISIHGEPGIPADVVQWDANNISTSLTSVLPQPNTIFQSYGLQLGPDSVIYHLYRETAGGPILMGALSDADTVATATTYTPRVFGNTNFNSRQFPSVSPSNTPPLAITFTSQGTCSNVPTSFFPEVTPDADSIVWDFGDGAITTGWAPVYTYTSGGAFNVTATAYLNGQSVSTSVPVNITQFDLQINLVSDTTACSCELPFPKAPNPPPPCTPFTVSAQVSGGSPTSIQWYGPPGLIPGAASLTLAPDSAGFYYIKVGDASGCFGYAGVNIKEYGVMDQRENVWYFGQNAGIDFNALPTGPPVAISNPVMDAPEGTATISDRNGQVIIFTDGDTVWDRDFNVLATGIGGSLNSTQSSLIAPAGSDETLYYIFTTEAVDGGGFNLRYSVYDLKIGLTGAVVESGVLLFSKSTERIIANPNWVIAHEWGNNVFRAYPITSNGIGTPVISSAGSDHAFTPVENAEGYMTLGAQGHLAVALSNPGTSNVIELFDFTDSSGVVSNPRILDLNQASGQIYGVVFSNAGNKLFATVNDGGNSIIYEYAIDSLGNATLLQSVPVAGSLGAMQRGPDGQIYIAVDGGTNVLRFSANEDITQLSALGALQQFPLVGGTSSNLGLPNFVQQLMDPLQGPGIQATGNCLGSPTVFLGSGTDPLIDQLQWFFGDGNTANGDSVSHVYAAAGTYAVSLRITNRCGLDTTLFQNITIVAPPAPPTFLQPGDVPVLCTGDLLLEATPASNPNLANLSFVWSTGDSTRTIVADRQAIYTVVISDNFGCTNSGSLFVADNRPVVDLPPNQTLCQNTVVFPLDAQNPGFTYVWSINGSVVSATQTQSVDTSAPGQFEYRVTVTDPILSCTATDSVIYTFRQSPVFTLAPTDPTTCGAADGSIDLQITAPATSLFQYSVTVPVGSPITAIDQPTGTYTIPNLAAGVYGFVVFDQVSQCFTSATQQLSDANFTINVTKTNPCDPLILLVTHTAALPYSYQVFDATSGAVVASGTPGTAGSFNTPGIPSGDYLIQVTSGGCVQVDGPQTYQQDPQVAITVFTADGCVNPVTLSVSTAAASPTFNWVGPNITSATNIASITATPPQGLQNYTVTVGAPGFCPIDFPVPVQVDNATIPTIAQSDACSDLVTISVTPGTGPYLYRWFRNGSLDAGLGGPQQTTPTIINGEQYQVQLFNSLSGCTYDTPPLDLLVVGDITVTLTSTAACEGSPFTITATTPQPVTSYQWELDGALLNGQTNSTLTDTRAGVYTAIVGLTGCVDDEDIQVLLAPLTPGSLNDRAIICDDPANTDPNTNQVVLNPGAGFISYDWFKDGVSLGITDPTFTATEAGLYSVDLLNSFNCPSNDRTQVDIECLPKITGPNAFRPDGTVNPDFFLYTFFIDDSGFEIHIFNRWGELVYQSVDRLFRWNGGYNNVASRPLPPGTYSYVVRYRSSYRPEDGIQEKRGGVVLLR